MRIGKLAWVIVAVFAFVPAAIAENDRNPSENTPADRALEGARLDTIHLAMANSYATLTQIVVVTPDCAFRGATSVTRRHNVNKVGITQDLPLIGEFFADTPRQGKLNAANHAAAVELACVPDEIRGYASATSRGRECRTAMPSSSGAPPFLSSAHK